MIGARTKKIYSDLQFSQVYAVVGNTDSCEGRGSDICLGYYEVQADAEREADGKGVMGTRAEVRPQKCLWIADDEVLIISYGASVKVVTANEVAEKQRALAKLSPRERQLLGLK